MKPTPSRRPRTKALADSRVPERRSEAIQPWGEFRSRSSHLFVPANPPSAIRRHPDPRTLRVHVGGTGSRVGRGPRKESDQMTEPNTQFLDIDAISVEDGFNPRGTFDDGELAELEASIRENGIVSALTVRQRRQWRLRLDRRRAPPAGGQARRAEAGARVDPRGERCPGRVGGREPDPLRPRPDRDREGPAAPGRGREARHTEGSSPGGSASPPPGSPSGCGCSPCPTAPRARSHRAAYRSRRRSSCARWPPSRRGWPNASASWWSAAMSTAAT